MGRRTWLHWLERIFPRTAQARRPKRLRTKPGLESLEDRMLPSTIVVTDLNDDGSANSLRAAVQQADQTGGTFTIKLLSGKTYHLNNGSQNNGDLPVQSTGAASVSLT